jgi:hypothetical protein
MAIEALDQNSVRVLAALRDAAALEREPTAASPDGRQQWFTITELAEEGRLLDGITEDRAELAALDRAGRRLAKKGLVAKRTIFTVTRYMVTGEGVVLLLGLEAAAGLSGLVSAQLGLEQALADRAAAERRVDEARTALAAQRREHGSRRALDILLAARAGAR